MATMQMSRPGLSAVKATSAAQPQDVASDEAIPSHGFKGFGERIAKRFGSEYLAKVLDRRELVRRTLRSVPAKMQKVTNQANLLLELFDDFRAQRYRGLPWHSVAVGSAALLYLVSPTEVLPDSLPGIGVLDDMLVISLSMRFMRKELEKYLAFKGYDSSKYF